MYTIKLKATARTKFTAWLREVHKMALTLQNIDAYIDDIGYLDENNNGYMEVCKSLTKSGNNEVYHFDYRDFEGL